MMQIESSCSFEDALTKLNETISAFIPHHFRRHWQRNQEALLIKKMTNNDKYSRLLQTISDFGMAITVEFKMSIRRTNGLGRKKLKSLCLSRAMQILIKPLTNVL